MEGMNAPPMLWVCSEPDCPSLGDSLSSEVPLHLPSPRLSPKVHFPALFPRLNFPGCAVWQRQQLSVLFDVTKQPECGWGTTGTCQGVRCWQDE